MPDETRHEIEAALADWRDLVAMAEERMDALVTAMEQARWAMKRLSGMATSMSEVRWQQTASPLAAVEPVAVEEPAPPVEARARPAYFAEPAPWPSPRHEPVSIPEAVEAEPEPELELDSETEAPAVEEATALDAEALREEVRRAVAAARAELEAGANHHDEQQPMTAYWGPMSGDWGPAVPPSEPDAAEDEREKVRRAVEEARAEMMGAVASDELAEAPVEESEGVDEPVAAEDQEDEREKVRRAVEAARAEMMGLSSRRGIPAEQHPEDEADGEEAPARIPKPQWQPASREDISNSAPVVVIEDGEGHVELARVYEILNRLELASQATLQNYTMHSVSIGINTREGMPDAGKLGEVVKAVFGRPCKVATEGSRLSVQLGHANGRVA